MTVQQFHMARIEALENKIKALELEKKTYSEDVVKAALQNIYTRLEGTQDFDQSVMVRKAIREALSSVMVITEELNIEITI